LTDQNPALRRDFCFDTFMSKENKNTIDVVIETPKGSRNKYAYNEKKKQFKLKKILPAGAVFPFDFGFIPGTKGEDGDPLDVLVIMDEPAFPGCLVECRLIGALKAKQEEKDGMVRNDRLIAVSVESRMYQDLDEIDHLSQNVLNEIEHFFTSYNQMAGKEFKSSGWAGAAEAAKLIKDGK
jgi:inorganic pyrophosphatase